MSELTNLLLDEKYKPKTLDDIVLENKSQIIETLKSPRSMIFYSESPGTGKSSLACVIGSVLNCDVLHVNASKERGIDTIREEIETFMRGMSTVEGTRRLVILEEADGLTNAAQKSLKELMDDTQDNAFIIFTTNDIAKITKPILSRCKIFTFKPSKRAIFERLLYIVEQEHLEIDPEQIKEVIDKHYPDMRHMLISLQDNTISNESLELLLKILQTKSVEELYSFAYSQQYEILEVNKQLFKYVFTHYDLFSAEAGIIAQRLADNEKSWNLGVNLPIVFISNMMQIMRYF